MGTTANRQPQTADHQPPTANHQQLGLRQAGVLSSPSPERGLGDGGQAAAPGSATNGTAQAWADGVQANGGRETKEAGMGWGALPAGAVRLEDCLGHFIRQEALPASEVRGC